MKNWYAVFWVLLTAANYYIYRHSFKWTFCLGACIHGLPVHTGGVPPFYCGRRNRSVLSSLFVILYVLPFKYSYGCRFELKTLLENLFLIRCKGFAVCSTDGFHIWTKLAGLAIATPALSVPLFSTVELLVVCS